MGKCISFSGQRVKGCYRAAGNGTLGPQWLGKEMVQRWHAGSIYRYKGSEREGWKCLGKGCSGWRAEEEQCSTSVHSIKCPRVWRHWRCLDIDRGKGNKARVEGMTAGAVLITAVTSCM